MEKNMENPGKEQKREVLDYFGEFVIREVRDRALKVSMDIASGTTANRIKREQYKAISNLSSTQKDAICDLLSETITDTIYLFMEMIEENNDKIEMSIIKDNQKYNITEISEKLGSELACYDDDCWIQKFSRIGRFVL
jgi:Mg2+ and Co2+ transporter CorA